jgi:hypothetical protein
VADIFQEVDEALRQDKAEAWWKKYSRYVYAAAILILLATGGYQLWKWYDQQQRGEYSDRFAAALEMAAAEDTEGALSAFAEIRNDGVAGYPMLAAFGEARLLVDQGQTAAAIELWDQIASDSAADAAYRGVATLLSVMHQVDDGDPAELQGRLDELIGPGEPFRASALELSAVLALRAGDKEKARSLYTQIVDDLAAPAGLRARATQILSALDG